MPHHSCASYDEIVKFWNSSWVRSVSIHRDLCPNCRSVLHWLYLFYNLNISFSLPIWWMTMECYICFGEMAEGDIADNGMVAHIRCKHDCHVQCLDTWLSQEPSCPYCRRPMIHPMKWTIRVRPGLCLQITWPKWKLLIQRQRAIESMMELGLPYELSAEIFDAGVPRD